MREQKSQMISWRTFGHQLILRVFWHWLVIICIWTLLLAFEETKPFQTNIRELISSLSLAKNWLNIAHDLQPALIPGALTFLCVACAWSALTIAAPQTLSLIVCALSTTFGGLVARFPIPEQASHWLISSGPHTSRYVLLSFVMLAGAFSCVFLMTRMTKQYERLSQDRLALSPSEEDWVVRSLVQSIVMLVLSLFGGISLWNIGNLRPLPAIASADPREFKPTVLIFAVHGQQHSENVKKHLGQPFFRSGVIFGSPETSAKFEELLQCRYPIRLVGQTNGFNRSNSTGDANDFFITSELEKNGYLVNLLSSNTTGESSEALKMLSRRYAHIRLFRHFGLLLPSRVYYTPDAQLSQVRETLSLSVSRGKSAFVTASLLTREDRKQTKEDLEQFKIFLETLEKQNWMRNLLIVVMEFPSESKKSRSHDLSILSTSAHVSFWATGSLTDSSLVQLPPKIVRGIDVGASLAARLRLSSMTAQCDGSALFDVSERPTVFPRDLVYQETSMFDDQQIFRKRGWLTADGYRLEIEESHEGNRAKTFKFTPNFGSYDVTWSELHELSILDQRVTLELNRQLDEFLRTTGVEILNIGAGRSAYSEPFRKISLLRQ